MNNLSTNHLESIAYQGVENMRAMNKVKSIIKVLSALLLVLMVEQTALGQYVDQALMFSQHNYGSTARSKGMGNAIGAIGGDFSSLSINPAGVGVYLRSELSGSLNMLSSNKTDATYQGQLSSDHGSNLNFRNFGYVFAMPTQSGNSGLVGINFGIGFNKLNSFNQTISVSKAKSPHSRMDAFAENSNGILTSDFYDENNPFSNGTPWESKLAWENYLIDVVNPDLNGIGNQYSPILLQNELVNQNMNITREGFINEYVFSLGANFNHQLYLGATIGMQDLYFRESSTYSENGEFGRFDFYNDARTRGAGYNLKLGAIYRPIAPLRLGLAFHTPTYYNFKEEFSSSMTSTLTNVSVAANGSHQADSPLGKYGYNLSTPTRAILSAAYQFGKKGMISADYELVDYSKARLGGGDDGYNFSSENSDVNAMYQSVSNFRIGGEFKPTDAVSLRAGYELFGNPYKSAISGISQPNANYTFHTINAGLGYRIDNVSLDLAYSLGKRTDYGYLYQISTANDPVKYEQNLSEIIFTIGIKF